MHKLMYNRDMSSSKLKFIKKEFLEDDYKLDCHR